MSIIKTKNGAVVVGIFTHTSAPIGIMYQYDDGSVTAMMFSLREAAQLCSELLASIEKVKQETPPPVIWTEEV